MEDGEVTVAYWLDGPLIYGLISQLERNRLLALAEEVRSSARVIPDAAPKQVNSRLTAAEARITRPEDNHHMDPMQRHHFRAECEARFGQMDPTKR